MEEFEAIFNAWQQEREGYERDRWERTRLLASIIIQPHVKNKICPEKILPLPWDKKRHVPDEPQLTPEERLKRFEKLK